MDNFFLQTACADCIKKMLVQWMFTFATVSGVALSKRHVRSCVLLALYFILCSSVRYMFQASLICRCCWFKSAKPFWSIWVCNQL